MEENPRNISTRRNGFGFSRMTLRRILKKDLATHPYQIYVRHELLPRDFERRVAYAEWFRRQCQLRPDFKDVIIIGDEAAFPMNGKVYSRNMREYAPKGQSPVISFERLSSRENINVWAGLCGNGTIIGPFFFDVNINGQTYLNVINEEIVPQMQMHFQFDVLRDVMFPDLWWF